MPDKKTDEKKFLTTVSGLADFWGMSRPRLQVLIREGAVGTFARGKVDLQQATQNYINYLKRQIKEARTQAGNKGKEDLNAAKLRLTTAQADAQEIKNQIELGRLIDLNLMTEILSEVSDNIASTLEQIPTNVKKKSPDLNQQALSEIRKQIVLAQNEAAEVEHVIKKVLTRNE